MTREELYALVWSQPMRTLAKSRGISDVALAKQCRKAKVPVPPRGWWARKEAGKAVTVQPLPPLPFVMDRFFPAVERQADTGRQPGSGEETSNGGEVPSPPMFRDMATVSREIQAAVRAIKVPGTLVSPHRIVARLLKQDAERKSKQSAGGYVSDYFGPKFSSPIQQRRLRILSCLFIELERLGCRISGSTHAGEHFSVKVGGHWTYILFGVEGGPSGSSFYRDRRRFNQPAGERLRFDLIGHDLDRTPPTRTWRDGDRPFEQQAGDIVCGILLRAEDDTRKWTLWRYKSDVEQRARDVREAKLAAEKAESDRIAREKTAAAARLKRLLDGADALERATRIRHYVTAVRAKNAAMSEPASAEALDAWAEWALAEADSIDPIASGRFLSDLNHRVAADEEH